MPYTCFSYQGDVPLSFRNRGAAQRAPRDLGAIPGYPCFAYPGPGIGNQGAAQSAPPGPRLMPLPCFSYPSDVPPGTRDRNAAQPVLPGLRRMPGSTCFRY
jgi:hypothetical protein